MLRVDKLDQYYGQSHTLWGVDFSVEEGSCTCIMGRNGVGKTTLLKSIMGLLPIKAGAIEFDGTSIEALPADARARLGIGYVPQGREIFPQLTVEENLRLGLLSGKRHKAIPERVYQLFPVLKEMLNRRGGDLSGGQQQQLAIGRALTLDPKLLILDEPTEGIQPNIVSEIGDILVKLNREEGLTLVVVEQKLHFAKKVGKDFFLLDRGRAVAGGKMAELTEALVQQYLTV